MSDLAGDSVLASTYIDPSCCRRSEAFSDGGGKGLSKTESYTDSMPVGPSGSSFDLLEYFEFFSAINSAGTLYIKIRKYVCLMMNFEDSHRVIKVSQLEDVDSHENIITVAAKDS